MRVDLVKVVGEQAAVSPSKRIRILCFGLGISLLVITDPRLGPGSMLEEF